jgi:hypothetical protein
MEADLLTAPRHATNLVQAAAAGRPGHSLRRHKRHRKFRALITTVFAVLLICRIFPASSH